MYDFSSADCDSNKEGSDYYKTSGLNKLKKKKFEANYTVH